MATRGYGGQHVPSARALMGMLAESKRQRAHTAEVAYGQLQQLQDEKALLSEKARAVAAERHAAEMRDVVHVLKEHVLKEHASSSSTGTRPVFSTYSTQLHQQQQLLQKGLDSNKPCMHLG
jgi:hypothetical protein